MNEQRTYTFALDVAGGTYISQFSGRSKEDALLSWSDNLDQDVITALGGASIEEIQKEVASELAEDGLTALRNITNVWFLYLSVRGIPGYLNIIQTEI